MISDLDAYQAAKILFDQRGPMADAFAASRIEELLQEGDFEGAMAWRRILRRRSGMRGLGTVVALALLTFDSAGAETVCVKYGSCLDLAPFECTDTPQSSLVRRVCYDASNSYMLIQLHAVWYHYCGIDSGTVSALLSAPSVGTYYNQAIRGRFDCRLTPPPQY